MYLFVYVHYLFHYLVVATFYTCILKILPCLNKDFVSYRIVSYRIVSYRIVLQAQSQQSSVKKPPKAIKIFLF